MMSKLLNDEKVVALIDKQVAKALKAKTKEIIEAVKCVDIPEDHAEAKVAKGIVKQVLNQIKLAA
jgi:hypothetical protein